MAMACSPLPLLLLVLLASSSLRIATPCSNPPDEGTTLRVMHAFGPCSPLHPTQPSFSWLDFLVEQSARDESRFLYLTSLATTSSRSSFVPIASGRQLLQIPSYVVRARLGTPPQQLLVAVDTSNDAAWFPCSSCVGCATSSPSFSPAVSSTYQPIPCGSPQCSQVPNPSCASGSTSCGFSMTYGSSSMDAAIGQDSLSLASEIVNSYTFGCVTKVTGGSMPPQGLLGLGRGPLSFLSQSKNLYNATFSYCLPSYKSLNFSGTLRLGLKGQPRRIKTTPLLANPRRSSLYYVNMIGVRVGNRVVPIPPSALAFDPATGAGTIVDSGTMFTRLVAPAYAAVRDEFRRSVKAPVTSLGGFDTCYNVSIVVPKIRLMFAGLTVTLPEDNVVIHSSSGSMTCLAMAAAPAGVNAVLNVIANMQQQNFRVLFDVPNSRIGIASERCTK
ncbi:aspartyl protease AED3-like [Typha angustifolia]|uniref:aspartyl protease AED3-like n=1 Tax=Typha angustifolia TaxID=59011 RepID=UPI003C2B440F